LDGLDDIIVIRGGALSVGAEGRLEFVDVSLGQLAGVDLLAEFVLLIDVVLAQRVLLRLQDLFADGDEGAALIGGDLLDELFLGLDFVLGGDTLVAIALGADVGDQLYVGLDVGELFAALSVGGLGDDPVPMDLLVGLFLRDGRVPLVLGDQLELGFSVAHNFLCLGHLPNVLEDVLALLDQLEVLLLDHDVLRAVPLILPQRRLRDRLLFLLRLLTDLLQVENVLGPKPLV